MKNVKIGIINWDAGFKSSEYFGGYALKTLGDKRHINRLPYYTIEENGKYSFPERTVEDYSKEMQYAIDAGIDYFAYCWYTEEDEEPYSHLPFKTQFLGPHLKTLNTARKLFEQSPLNSKIKMCAILVIPHGYSDNDLKKLAIAMTKPYYQRINGRPLVYIFSRYDEITIDRVKAAAKEVGEDPYICFFNMSKDNEGDTYKKADAVSSYVPYTDDLQDFNEMATKNVEENEKRKKYGLQVIPVLSAGWDPQPRIDNSVPWITYANKKYLDTKNGEGLPVCATELKKWMQENAEYTETGHILCYAWNEFEEGGWVCPTLNSDGTPNTKRVENFKTASDILKG